MEAGGEEAGEERRPASVRGTAERSPDRQKRHVDTLLRGHAHETGGLGGIPFRSEIAERDIPARLQAGGGEWATALKHGDSHDSEGSVAF